MTVMTVLTLFLGTIAATLALRSPTAAKASHLDCAHGAADGPGVLRILAFGDSLTEGFYARGSRFHSYSIRLRQLLKDSLPPGSRVVVDERGWFGEFVLTQMKGRLIRALNASVDDPFDWVILLGGTNDIGTGAAAADVFVALTEMHAAAANAGANVLAMTLPHFNTQLSPERLAEYRALNGALRQRFSSPLPPAAAAAKAPPAAAARAPKKGAPAGQAAAAEPRAPEGPVGVPLMLLLDLEPLFPTTALSPEARREIWDDHLHLTPKGYDQMGEHVFNALRAHLPGVRT